MATTVSSTETGDRIAYELADFLAERAEVLQAQRGHHRGRQRAEAQAADDIPVHIAVVAVGERAGGLGRGGECQVGADRDRRVDRRTAASAAASSANRRRRRSGRPAGRPQSRILHTLKS